MINEDLTVSINEIFYSIQGEAKNSGKPTIFIRTAGCPFRCSYCDTEYAFTEGNKFKISNIISKIKSYKTNYVTVTGGEPLAQKNIIILLSALLNNSYNVSIETSGLLDISDIPNDIEIVMDIKTPSSNEDSKNIKNNLSIIKKTDVIKFVIGNREDYEWSKDILIKNSLTHFKNIYFSPVHDALNLSDLADWILSDNLNVTLQLQLHKYIWGDERGR
jgi:7-carboxy-7-deazaguanine synthase|tara:strand:- start:313 stop:966 length:654 start_codon:yes stop_codon:yes gene_type:complete